MKSNDEAANCVNFDEAIKRCKFGKFNYILIAVSGGVMACAFFELTCVNFILPLAECDLDMSSTDKGILGSVGYLGLILSSHLWGFLADTKGRRSTLIPGLLVAFITTILSALANSFWLLVFLRFINGFFISCTASTTVAYLGEFHDSRNRARVILAGFTVFAIMNMMLPAFALVTINSEWSFDILHVTFKPWRLYLLICGIPSLCGALILIFVLPESPKFTFAQGSIDRTLAILQRMYRMNTGQSVESFSVKSIEKSDEFNEALQNKSQGFFHYMWSQTVPLFKGSNLRNILTACYIQFAVCNASNSFWTFLPEILNKLNLWSDAGNGPATVCEIFTSTLAHQNQSGGECTQKLEMNTFLHIFELGTVYVIAYGIISLVINKTGKLILILIIVWTTGIAAFSLIFVKVPVISSYLYMTLIAGGLAYGVINASTVELFPTSMRAMAVCISLMIGRLGSTIGSVVIGLMINDYCSWTFLMPTFLLISSGFLAFTIPNISKKHG